MMNSTRRTSTATGALLVLATMAALGAAAFDPTLTGTGYLAAVANQPNRLAVAALLYLVAAGTSVGIAITLNPVLEKVNAGLALTSVVFRAIEAVLYTTAVVALLSLGPLSKQLASGPGDSRAPIQAIADSLLSVRDHATLAAVFAFNVGALSYYALFYRSRLVPRWLSGWGMAGVLLLTTACLLALFSDNPVTGYTLLILPATAPLRGAGMGGVSWTWLGRVHDTCLEAITALTRGVRAASAGAAERVWAQRLLVLDSSVTAEGLNPLTMR